MENILPKDWNVDNISGLVSIGSHSLFVSTLGPPRTSPSQPIILLISGTGGTLAKWPAFVRSLSPHCRIFTYDRSGMGKFEPAPDTKTPTLDIIASDLHAVLEATNIQPPYVLLAHSWGGMLATYFAFTFPKPQTAMSGLVLLDAGAPTQSAPLGQHKDFTTDPGSPWSHPCVFPIVQGLDMLRLTAPPDRCALTAEEYEYLRTSTSTFQHHASATEEFAALQASYAPFRARSFFSRSPPFLSSVPIAIVHAHAYASFQTLYDAGVGACNGTLSERVQFQHLMETWKQDVLQNQEQFLTLTEPENGKVVLAKEGTGHDVMMMDVDACVEGVRWVLERIERRKHEEGVE